MALCTICLIREAKHKQSHCLICRSFYIRHHRVGIFLPTIKEFVRDNQEAVVKWYESNSLTRPVLIDYNFPPNIEEDDRDIILPWLPYPGHKTIKLD